jgi:hypothetical protein
MATRVVCFKCTYMIKVNGKGKVVPVLFFNRAPHSEGVLGNGGIAPRLL